VRPYPYLKNTQQKSPGKKRKKGGERRKEENKKENVYVDVLIPFL
jgi:hypothetical protein